MAKSLIITEKPSVARDIGKVLGCRSCRTHLENDRYIITWSLGHLVSLAMPEDYDPRYKKWALEDLPIIPPRSKLVPLPGTKARYQEVKKLLNSPQVSEVINAADAGREGELIFRYIYSLAGCDKPVKRLWLNSLTDKSILKGMDNLQEGSHYDTLYYSARCRAESDWLVGLNATRAFTLRHGAKLTVGRVQTPTLAILVQRELEIRDFKPEDYFQVVSHYREGYAGIYYKEKTNQIKTRAEAEKIIQKVQGETGEVAGVKEETKKEVPPLLFDLTELQRRCHKLLKLSAKETLDTAQSLYEKKLITYPRTDSRYLPGDINVYAILPQLDYRESKTILEKGWKISPRCINDKKVTDHHAIIPTGKRAGPGGLSPGEEKVYDIIARRFLAVFYPDHIYNVTVITACIKDETFLSRGKSVVQEGWKEVEQEKVKEEFLPPVSRGDRVTVCQAELKECQTRPPARYNEATLLSAMENAGRMAPKELSEYMKENGLGTPATRAEIIEKLIQAGYVQREKKHLVPTDKGIYLVDIVPDKLKSPGLTGEWEKKLKDIRGGTLSPGAFLQGIKDYTKEIVDTVSKLEVSMLPTGEEVGRCPLCGNPVTQNSKGYGCAAWKINGCKFFIGKIAQKELTQNQVKTLLEKGKTKTIKGFISNQGNKFEAMLTLREGRVEFTFIK